MRSSNKARSRNKNNNRRQHSTGNVVNRVFDSAGPSGKVRGTPQQIVEKYAALAGDAQLAGDRVAAENFSQHSEHYARILSIAMKEQADRQAEHQKQQMAQQQARQERESEPRNRETTSDSDAQPPMASIETEAQADLVSTPENAVTEKPKRRSRTKQPAPQQGSDENPAPVAE